MTGPTFDHANEAKAALLAVVSDPAHGADALSDGRVMANLLQDLLPDAPREVGLLVAAAQAGAAQTLRDHASQGLDARTAIGLTASSLAATTAFGADSCAWVVGELAIALGLALPIDLADGNPPLVGQATEVVVAHPDETKTLGRSEADVSPYPVGAQVTEHSPAQDIGGSQPATAGSRLVPPMPVIRPSERFIGSPYPLVEGPRVTIGWQGQPESKGGTTFVIIAKTALGSFRVLERFPLSADGWARAWQALLKASPDAADKVTAALSARAAEDQRLQARHGFPPEAAAVGNRLARPIHGVPAGEHRAGSATASYADELTKLAALLENGLLTRQEFELMKARLLGTS